MPETLIDPQVSPEPTAAMIVDPLWLVRLRLLSRSLRSNWKLLLQNRLGGVGLVAIAIFGLMAIAHPLLLATVWPSSIYDPIRGYDAPVVQKTVVEEVKDPVTEIDLATARLQTNPLVEVGDVLRIGEQPAPPTFGGEFPHYLGTDPFGRDVLSQLLYSARSAFLLGMIASIVTVVLATAVGSVAAYFGGWVDSVLMRLADLILLVPLLPVLIVVSALFSIGLPLLGLLIGILGGFGGTAIILKSQALGVSVKPFIDAARIAGGGHGHLILRHIVPNVLPLSFLYMMFTVTEAIALEATLSFLGLLSVPMSWGIMLSIARSQGYLLANLDYWWLWVPAGLAVSILAASFFLVGRAMDEVVNPRLRER